MIPYTGTNHKNQLTLESYNKLAPQFYARFISLDTEEQCQKFLSLLPDKAHILDVGCGPGRDTKYFLERGYQVTAVDGSEELVKLGRQHTGHPILHMTFDEIAFQNEFDGIWAMASLLHLDRKELIETLRKNIIPALKSQGILYLCFKYGAGENFSKDRYFKDYTEESLTELLYLFEDLSIIDIWSNEENTPDRNGRLWVNGLVRKK